jgi:hypothetical protein
MEAIEIFIEFLRLALTRVHNDYYGLHWWNESMLNSAMSSENSKDKEILKDFLDRYDERVFCYELYHQIRVQMEEFSKNKPELFRHIKLQCELKKDFIHEIVENYFKVKRLDAEYIPDFLLHTPGNFTNQHLIVEVKSNPQLSFNSIQKDLLKIQEFINRYNYQLGIFLTVNTNPSRMINILKDENHRKWLTENINTPERVLFMCKKKNDVELFECQLNNLPRR